MNELTQEQKDRIRRALAELSDAVNGARIVGLVRIVDDRVEVTRIGDEQTVYNYRFGLTIEQTKTIWGAK